MKRYRVHVAETRSYQFYVEAENMEDARDEAHKLWRDAPEVGGYEIPDTQTAFVLEVATP